MQADKWPPWLVWIIVPVCYFAGARLGVSVALMPEGVAILWPPNSVLLTAMLLRPLRDMPLIGALGIATEIAADVPTLSVVEATVFGVANALESALACLLLRHWRFDGRLSTVADLAKFVIAGPGIAALLAAVAGAAAYRPIHEGGGSFLDLARIWWMGDAMGLIIFTPLLLSVTMGGRSTASPPWNAFDVLAAAGGALVAAVLVVSHSGSLGRMHVAPVLLLPFILVLAARRDLRVVSAAVAVAGLAVAYGATHGRDPFGALPVHEQTLRTQEFIFTMGVLALGLAALLAQLRARQDELRAANERLDELNRHLEARVAERTAQLDDSNRQLEQLAMTDPLTAVANRRAFFAASRGLVQNALRHGRPLALMMVDIDRFKLVNDRHGHGTGDAVLRHVADTLRGMLRAGDLLARYGGEEFVVLAPETDAARALALAERMGEALRASSLTSGSATIRVTASFGVSALGARGDTLDRLIQRADQALYECKRQGRDRARVWAGDDAVTPPA